MLALYRTLTAVMVLPCMWAQAPSTIQPRVHADPNAAEEALLTHLRLDTSLVMVPVQATRSDAPVLNLTSANFKVFENGKQQDIRYFAQDDAPVSIGILVDTSASMRKKKRKAAEAAAAFLRMANQEDEFFLVEFDEGPRLKLPFTTDIPKLNREVEHMRPFGRTSLYDAVYLALEHMKRARFQRKALVIFSDGGDNHSRRNLGTVQSRAAESGVPIYSLGVFDPEDNEEELNDGPRVLDLLASITGGRHFPVQVADLAKTSELLGRLLRNEYLLGYQPVNDSRDGTFRRITLEVNVPNGPIDLYYRKGYFAPNQ